MAEDVRVIVVDPVQQRVYERVVKDKLKSFQKLVDGYVEEFHGVDHLFPRHSLFVNEEGKLAPPPHHGWMLSEVEEIFVGTGVLFKVSGSRKRDSDLHLEDVLDEITWLGAGTAHIPRPTIIFQH